MENQTNNQAPKSGLLNQPRKAVSGLVYSGTIIGMVIISLLFAITLAAVARLLGVDSASFADADWYKYLSYFLYQIVYIAIIFAFARIYKNKPREFGYRKTHWKYYIIAIVLGFGLLFGLNWMNNLFALAIEKMGGVLPEISLPSLKGGGLFGVLLVVAVLPAILEETIFRGIILEGIKDIGTVAACLLGGLLFSIFHQNPMQTVYQFVCGAAFTLLAIRADSILPAVFVHFANNAFIIFDTRFGWLAKASDPAMIVLYVLAGVALVLSLGYLIFVDRKTNRKKQGAIKPLVIFALAGIIINAIMWFTVLAGYFA